jgi:small-conductance mechanosensitive channel
MKLFSSAWRCRVTRIVVVVGLLVTSGISSAAKAPPSEEPAKLPTPLTREAVRELVSKLPDEEVRKLLIDQLDRNADKVHDDVKAKPGIGVLGVLEQNARLVRDRAAQLVRAAGSLPFASRELFDELGKPDGARTLGLTLGFFALMIGAGAAAEYAWHYLSRSWRRRLDITGADQVATGAVRIVLRFVMHVVPVLAFGVAALVVFLALWQGRETNRILLLGLLAAIVVARLVAAVVNFLLAPSKPDARLLPLADAPAATLARTATVIAALWGAGYAAQSTFAAAGATPETREALVVIVGLAILVVGLRAIWQVREPISEMIRRAAGRGPLAGFAADLWPIVAALYVVFVFGGWLWETLTDVRIGSAQAIISLLVVLGLPIVDFAACRAVAAVASATRADGRKSLAGVFATYEPVLRRLIHIFVIVGGVLALARVWDVDVFAVVERNLGEQLSSSLLGIVLVVLIAYLAWEIARTAIDRRIRAEDHVAAGSPTSRLRTLLPLLRITIMIAIVVMATMSILAALGIDILPLLAGAGVIGLAVGIGSQTLVRDVVAGAFFLLDDAFRLGEYIEAGSSKGTVEKITVRSVFLRHHHGALKVLPYGEIKEVSNTSRDWQVIPMEFKLALDTDVRKVRRIVKEVGATIAADPELGAHLIDAPKSQGVKQTDDVSMLVAVKFKARPGDGGFQVRRAAYEEILKAFAENGIEFSGRRVVAAPAPHEARADRTSVAGAEAVATGVGAGSGSARS